MDMEHKIPKKLGVLATHGDGEPPKTLDARYVKENMYYFNNPEKTTSTLLWETRWINVNTLGIIA